MLFIDTYTPRHYTHFMANTILKYDPNEVPIELRASPLHPSTDKYFLYLQEIQKAIVDASQQMPIQAVSAVKLNRLGKSYTDIGKDVGRSPAWVSRTLKAQPARKLATLLEFYQTALDGPTESQRRNILWRVALANEDKAPKTTITAVSELNRMDGTGVASNQPQQTTVVINQTLFPKGELD